MNFQLDALEEALRTLGSVLQERKTPYSPLIVGGSGLLLLRLIDRPTADLDVIGMSDNGRYLKIESLPRPLAEAAVQVAQALELSEDWLNTGPASLMDSGLPQGWEKRIEVRRYDGLEIQELITCLGSMDVVMSDVEL